MKTSPYLKLERQIAADERGSIVHRWQYGQALLAAKGEGRKLPDGLLRRPCEGGAEGRSRPVTPRDPAPDPLRRGVQIKGRCVRAGRNYGSWTALRDAGFPPVEPDGTDPRTSKPRGSGSLPTPGSSSSSNSPDSSRCSRSGTVRYRSCVARAVRRPPTSAPTSRCAGEAQQLRQDCGPDRRDVRDHPRRLRR